jgi:hypothetical protein
MDSQTQLGNGMSLQIASAQGLIPKTDGTRCLIAGYDKKEMAGYSGTPLAQKLGIKAGQKVATIGRPAGYGKLLAPLPDAVSFATNVEPGSAFIHLFVSERKGLEKELKRLRKLIADTGTLWVSWPKKSSGVATDVTEDVIREVALPLGFVDVKVCAVDETWSGLKLMIRRENRR